MTVAAFGRDDFSKVEAVAARAYHANTGAEIGIGR